MVPLKIPTEKKNVPRSLSFSNARALALYPPSSSIRGSPFGRTGRLLCVLPVSVCSVGQFDAKKVCVSA